MSSNRLLDQVKGWARSIKRDVVALWIAARDPRVSLFVKLLAGLVAAYALSPIDLIPDFIPVVCYLDDLLIVPLGILAVVKLIPAELMTEFRADALSRKRPKSVTAAAVIVCVWLLAIGATVWLVWPDS